MRERRINKRILGAKPIAFLLCGLMIWGPAGSLLAAGETSAAPSSATSTAYRDVMDQLAAEEARKELFTLAQVRDMARSRGAEAQAASRDLSIAEANKNAADMAFYDAMYMGIGVAQAVSGRETADINLDDAKAAAKTQAEVAIYTGEAYYFSYLELMDTIALLEKNKALLENGLSIERLMASIGLSTATNVRQKELALNEVTENIAKLRISLDLTGRSLMRQIGKDPDLDFRLDPEYSIEGLREEYDAGQLAEQSVRNNLNLEVLTRTIDKLLDSIESGMSPSQRDQIGSQTDKLILNRGDFTHQLRTLAHSTATGLATSRQDILLLEEKLAEKQRNYETVTLQVSIGLAAKIESQAAEVEIISAENDLIKARHNYYLSLRKAALLQKGIAIIPSTGGAA
jgi:outer membrane protein TolC